MRPLEARSACLVCTHLCGRSYFQGLVQYNLEGAGPSVSIVCSALSASSSQPLAALASAVKLINDHNDTCVPSSWEQDFVAAQQLTNVRQRDAPRPHRHDDLRPHRHMPHC